MYIYLIHGNPDNRYLYCLLSGFGNQIKHIIVLVYICNYSGSKYAFVDMQALLISTSIILKSCKYINTKIRFKYTMFLPLEIYII